MIKRWLHCALAAMLPAAALTGCSLIKGSTAPGDLELPIAVGLDRNQNGLAQELATLTNPTSSRYLEWITPQQIQQQFGASQDSAQYVLNSLRNAGLDGDLDPTGSLIIGKMTVSEASNFFDVTINVTQGDQGVSVAQPSEPLNVPRDLLQYVDQVVGLDFQLGANEPSPATAPPGTDPQCPPKINLSETLNSLYNFESVRTAGKNGQGVRIAMLEIDYVSQFALKLASTCAGVPLPPVTAHQVDGSLSSVFGNQAEESTLDAIAASIIAPGISAIDMYQFNPYSSIVFPLAAAINDTYQPDGAQFISTSVGFCEANVNEASMQISEWLLMSAGATGVTTIASAGDTGSTSCYPQIQNQEPQYPASSPNVVAIGGTQVGPGPNGQPTEQVWNSAPTQMQAGGGSTASQLARPAFQSQIPGAGKQRVVPDIALVASPAAFGPIPVCTVGDSCTMEVVGGTSATAPGFTAAMGLVLQALQTTPGAPKRLGPLNPTLYSLAQSKPSVFNDITRGNNDLHNVGCCQAEVGFDAASGWGSVNLANLLAGYQSLIKAKPAG